MSVAWALNVWATNSWVGMNGGPPNAWRGSATPAPVTTANTPGRIRPFGQVRGETEEQKRARRIAEGSLPSDVPPPSAVYVEKSARITAAIERLRGETAQYNADASVLRTQIAAYEAQNKAKALAKAERALMLKEQSLTLARAQEAALLEDLEVIDIAYVAVIALTLH